MSEAHLDRSPVSHHQKSSAGSIGTYPVRRMRNTAVLVKWIEEHQTNPYPTKAEKQYLAYYSGMNLTQLSTWFANARRRIKKIGMKTWLEGRSTFTVDFLPSSSLSVPFRQGMAADYAGSASTYPAASPYAAYTPTAAFTAAGLHGGYAAPQGSIGLQSVNPRILSNGMAYTSDASTSQHNSSPTISGLYGTQTRGSQPNMLGMMGFSSNWSMASSGPLLHSSSTTLPRTSGTVHDMQSPLAAYSADTSHLRTHSGPSMEVSDGPYSMSQHSPDSMQMPECASGEPILQDSKTAITA